VLVRTPPPDPSPSVVGKKIVRYCRETTRTSREMLEQTRGVRLTADYVKYPGKMDHTTIVVVLVDLWDPDKDGVGSRSLNEEVWPFG